MVVKGLFYLFPDNWIKIIRNDKNISIQIQNKDGIHTIKSKKVILAARINRSFTDQLSLFSSRTGLTKF